MDVRNLESRQAIVRLAIELFVGGAGATRRPPDMRLVYLIVLDATLSGLPVTASRIALTANIQRTTVRRKLQALKAEGVIVYQDGGWRVAYDYLTRSEAKTWVSRLEGLITRTNDIIRNGQV